jgi:hypothetical protein
MISQKDFTGIDLPAVIYKYRDWNEDFHKRIITKREVYLSSPIKFTDKNDCRIPIRYDLFSQSELKIKVKTDNPDWPRQKRRKFLSDWYKVRKYKVMEMQKSFQEDFFDRFGVLSLTAIPDNKQMWIDYACNSTGFCVGFNTEIMFNYLGGGRIVEYYDQLPIIYPEPKHSIEEQHILQIFSKLKVYEYEKEYRTQIFSRTPLTEEDRKIILPPEAYKEIIFGEKMPDKIQEQLLQNIPLELDHVVLVN